MEVIRVAIADGAVARGSDRLRTTGLGSCVGVVLFESRSGLSGMVHVMLPNAPVAGTDRPTKYADVGVDWLVDQLHKAGAKRSQLRAKIAGGAQMFNTQSTNDVLRVGPRNVDAVLNSLNRLEIPLLAADTGGSVGRTIEFDPETETLWVRTAFKGQYGI